MGCRQPCSPGHREAEAVFQGEELGRGGPGGQEILNPLSLVLVPQTRQPHLAGLGVPRVPRRLGPQLLRASFGPAQPSCRKPEIRGAEPLRLLREEPRLLKETAAPRDTCVLRRAEPAPARPSPEGEPRVLKETGEGGVVGSLSVTTWAGLAPGNVENSRV